MTYLQRANGENKAPFYYSFNENKKSKSVFYHTLCVGLTEGQEETQLRFLSREFFNPYIKITKEEFDAAFDAAMKCINEKRNSIV